MCLINFIRQIFVTLKARDGWLSYLQVSDLLKGNLDFFLLLLFINPFQKGEDFGSSSTFISDIVFAQLCQHEH